VARLAAYRGVTRLGALTLASEVGDWRRFATAPQFMGLLRAGPQRLRQRQLHLAGTHYQDRERPPAHPAGRVRLGLPAPTPGHLGAAPSPARLSPETVARAWKAQLRLCGRFRRLHARKNAKQLVVIAVARELAGFLWAEMVAEHA